MPSGHFDYVIIGGGSAGSVLAARLTEDPDTRVLLLEAGGTNTSVLVRMPLGVGQWLRSHVPRKARGALYAGTTIMTGNKVSVDYGKK